VHLAGQGDNILRPIEAGLGYRYRGRLSVRHVARRARCWSVFMSAKAAMSLT